MIRVLITRQSRYPSDTKEIKVRIKNVLTANNVTDATVSVVLVGVRKMRELAVKYYGEKETDPLHEVFSFPAQEPAVDETGEKINFAEGEQSLDLGDIFICYPEARRIAMKRNRMVDDVIGELAEHGTLHLLGIHHD